MIELIDEKQYISKELAKNSKDLFFVFNMLILIIGIIMAIVFGVISFILMIAGVPTFFLLIILGLSIVIFGFVLAKKTDNYMVGAGKTKIEEEKEIKIRKILVSLFSLLGLGVIATVAGILVSMEWDLW